MEIEICNNNFPEEEYYKIHDEYQKWKDSLMDFSRYFEIASLRLKKIYEECDLSETGHLKPDKEKGICDYCSRHLKYGTPKVDEIIEERRKLHWSQRPFDAPLLMDLGRTEISSQRTIDWFRGLTKVMNELKEAELKK